MNKRAFTIVELLCVIVIIAVLSALLMPVFATAKMGAKRSATAQNIKGFWQALMLYQADEDQTAEYGSASAMGLPEGARSWLDFVNKYTGDLAHDDWRTKTQFVPCGLNNDVDMGWIGITYWPLTMAPWWKDEVLRHQQNTIVMFDKNCNPPGTRVLCQFCNKRSIGITLGGQIKDRMNALFPVMEQSFYQ